MRASAERFAAFEWAGIGERTGQTDEDAVFATLKSVDAAFNGGRDGGRLGLKNTEWVEIIREESTQIG